MCIALGIPQCSYYQWSRQEIKRNLRRQRETDLVQTVRSVFEEFKSIYGCTKLLRELNDRSVDINEYKLRRIMRENGLYSVVVKKFKPYKPGKSDGMYAQNLLQRNFTPVGLNQYWCGDITYIRTNLGWGYLAELKIEPSMSAPGCPYDNAAMESFFASLKKELVHHRTYADIDEVKEGLFKYIELFYNRKRLHSSLGYLTPVAYRLQKLCA